MSSEPEVVKVVKVRGSDGRVMQREWWLGLPLFMLCADEADPFSFPFLSLPLVYVFRKYSPCCYSDPEKTRSSQASPDKAQQAGKQAGKQTDRPAGRPLGSFLARTVQERQRTRAGARAPETLWRGDVNFWKDQIRK